MANNALNTLAPGQSPHHLPGHKPRSGSAAGLNLLSRATRSLGSSFALIRYSVSGRRRTIVKSPLTPRALKGALTYLTN